MDAFFEALAKIAESTGVPGLVITAFLGIGWFILQAKIFPRVDRQLGYKIIIKLLNYAFILSVLLVVASYGSAFYLNQPQKENGSPISEPVKPTFAWEGQRYEQIIRDIENSTGIKQTIDKNANFRISIAYSGELREAANAGRYLYGGGYVLVTVNDFVCAELRDLSFPAWNDEPGNDRNLLQQELKTILHRHIINNQERIADAISKCIEEVTVQ